MPNRARFRTTWDGLFISEEPPHGATVIVRRRDGGTVEYLLLHRADATDGDWAWGPPAGVRLPGEDIEACARRALEDSTGLRLPLHCVTDDPTWAAFWVEARPLAEIALTGDYDGFAWAPLDEAVHRCRPAIVGEQFEQLAAVVAA